MAQQEEKVIHLTQEEALDCMKIEEGEVHCFIPAGPTLIGAHWGVEEIRELMKKTTHPDHIQIAGEGAQRMNHAVAIFDTTFKHHCFFESIPAKISETEGRKRAE